MIRHENRNAETGDIEVIEYDHDAGTVTRFVNGRAIEHRLMTDDERAAIEPALTPTFEERLAAVERAVAGDVEAFQEVAARVADMLPVDDSTVRRDTMRS
jgi:hypothetical protein